MRKVNECKAESRKNGEEISGRGEVGKRGKKGKRGKGKEGRGISSINGGSLVLMCCHPDPTALTASESAAYIAALSLSSSARLRDDESTRENTCSE